MSLFFNIYQYLKSINIYKRAIYQQIYHYQHSVDLKFFLLLLSLLSSPIQRQPLQDDGRLYKFLPIPYWNLLKQPHCALFIHFHAMKGIISTEILLSKHYIGFKYKQVNYPYNRVLTFLYIKFKLYWINYTLINEGYILLCS